MTAVCIFGGAADGDGVCVEHGERACVVTYAPEENCLQVGTGDDRSADLVPAPE